MITPLFIFTVFMLTLGPIKTVPAFFAMTQNQAPGSARVLALQGTMGATAVSLPQLYESGLLLQQTSSASH
jgi:hypothetical protein